MNIARFPFDSIKIHNIASYIPLCRKILTHTHTHIYIYTIIKINKYFYNNILVFTQNASLKL